MSIGYIYPKTLHTEPFSWCKKYRVILQAYN